jgi:UDP-glucose 4-epimerase
MNILVTGGAGYIGSHAVIELLAAEHRVVVIDNLSNSKREALHRVRQITHCDFGFIQADLQDTRALKRLFDAQDFDAVIHFAGLKAVGESTTQPWRYYDNNVQGTLSLCAAMMDAEVWNLVFSSSATVYGDSQQVPFREDMPVMATNPYGHTKVFVEQILRDLQQADPRWNIALLRYFNPVGAHVSGLIGEDPQGVPNNLFPYITQVAVGRLAELQVFGDDYSTPDGTGVRDYIHVVDLVRGHIQALKYLSQQRDHEGAGSVATYNLGTGRGYSVLDIINTFKEVTGRDIPYRVVARRPGDVAMCYADPTRAQHDLQWRATLDIQAMVADTWRWQINNPNGYPLS